MAKEEAEERVAKAMSERDEVIKALEVEKVDQKAREEAIREKAVRKIMQYGMTFRRLALFMVRKKYPDLDFSDINLLNMRRHDSPNPSGPAQVASVQLVEEGEDQAEGVGKVEGIIETEEV